MVASFETPVVSPVLVGREAQLGVLDQALRRARDGQGGTLLLGGEAGIGKSRLVAEARERAGRLGLRVLQGACFEPTRTLPYAPLLDLLRVHFATLPPRDVAEELGAAAPELVKLLPELTLALPGLVPSPALDPQQERYRLFETVTRYLLGLAARGAGLLIVFEDLHWAEDTSLEFLPYLARRIADQPVLLLATYRSDEPQPALRHTLATLDRARLATDVPLERLSRGEVDALLRAIFRQQHPIRPDFLSTVQALTDGNPFFIEEVLRALIAAGEIFQIGGHWERKALGELHIPRSVQDAVMRRAERLSPAARQVLRLAAVAGQRFDFDVLRELTGYDEGRLLDLVRELIAAQLVVEESAERFAFRHALTREAVYAELLARERQALHRTIGDVLERLHAAMPEPYLADLAYHFDEAGDWRRALDYACRAGSRAWSLHAPGAAIEQFTRALDAADRLGIAAPGEVLRLRGQAQITLGRFEAAKADLSAALARAQQSGDRVAEWQARLDLGSLWVGRDYVRAGEAFQQALVLAREIGDQRMLAASLVQLGNWQVNIERPDEAEVSLSAALAIFETLGDAQGIAETTDLLGIVVDISGDIALMYRRIDQAADLYRQLGDRRGLASALSSGAIVAGAGVYDGVVVPAGISTAEQAAKADEALATAREIGWRSGEAYALLMQAIVLRHQGRVGESARRVAASLEVAREIDHREWMALGLHLHGQLALDLLDWPTAREWLERAHDLARSSGSGHFVHATAGFLITACLEDGDPARAEAVIAEFADPLPMRTIGQRLAWLARARYELARGNALAALDIVDRLLDSAARLRQPGDAPYVAWLRGEALYALGRHAEAVDMLERAIAGADERDMAALFWRARLALAQRYASAGREAEAAEQRRRAREIVDVIASCLDDPVMRDGFAGRALALFPSEAAPPARDRRLTARERDVAALVARGLSNREVADALFVGERTVETHVGNILGKLGFTSRAQIAAWVVETELVKGHGA